MGSDAHSGGLPNLEELFLNGRQAAFGSLLSPALKVHTDLRPILYDRGALSRQQALMAFSKLRQRYAITNVAILNSQSDTNYSWLEIYLQLALRDKHSGMESLVMFAFHFKVVASRMAISRWVLQDIR